MRVLSNYASVGFDGGSTLIKKKNQKISQGALEKMLSAKSIEEWASQCINEHPTPLKETWDWLKMNAEEINDEAVWAHLVENSMVTISKEEDALLSKLGLRSNGAGSGRYKKAKIKVSIIDTSPENLFKRIEIAQKERA